MSYWVYMLNISIDVFVFAIGVIGLITSLYNSRSDKTVEKHFIVIFIYMLLYVSSNLAGLLMRGMPGPTYRIALYFVNFCEFLFCTMLGHKVSVYMTDICIQDEKHDRDVRSLLNLLLLLPSQSHAVEGGTADPVTERDVAQGKYDKFQRKKQVPREGTSDPVQEQNVQKDGDSCETEHDETEREISRQLVPHIGTRQFPPVIQRCVIRLRFFLTVRCGNRTVPHCA